MTQDQEHFVPLAVGARRNVAKRHALAALVSAGDPVAVALDAAIEEATTVEITRDLVDRFRRLFESETLRDEEDRHITATLRAALAAAGFEVKG